MALQPYQGAVVGQLVRTTLGHPRNEHT